MKKIYSIIALFVITVSILTAVNFAFAEDRELTPDDEAAFIVREEWTTWTKNFTASLSELDKEATQKIYEDMDFYDMQYRFTDTYKNKYDPSNPEYAKWESSIKEAIKIKRKERSKRK